MSHSQRCISANRFGDGFDCICDEEPLAKALEANAELAARITELEKQLAQQTRQLGGMGRVASVLHQDEQAELNAAIQYAADTFDNMMLVASEDMPEIQAWLNLAVVKRARGIDG